jgi:hypothetical protein
LHQPPGRFGRFIVSGLNGLRNRSIDGAGPRPTGRLTPPLGLIAMKVVAWRLEAGLLGTASSSTFLFSSSGSFLDGGRGGELEKQEYGFCGPPSFIFGTFGFARGRAEGSLCFASSGSIDGFCGSGAFGGRTFDRDNAEWYRICAADLICCCG